MIGPSAWIRTPTNVVERVSPGSCCCYANHFSISSPLTSCSLAPHNLLPLFSVFYFNFLWSNNHFWGALPKTTARHVVRFLSRRPFGRRSRPTLFDEAHPLQPFAFCWRMTQLRFITVGDANKAYKQRLRVARFCGTRIGWCNRRAPLWLEVRKKRLFSVKSYRNPPVIQPTPHRHYVEAGVGGAQRNPAPGLIQLHNKRFFFFSMKSDSLEHGWRMCGGILKELVRRRKQTRPPEAEKFGIRPHLHVYGEKKSETS